MTTQKEVAAPVFDELYQTIEDSFELKGVKIHILVFGPDLSGDGTGSELRKHIISKCKEDSFIVVLAEHEEIQKRYKKILGTIHDLCKMEFHLATTLDKNHGHDLIDGIIILPDSAGSLVELGMFALEDRIHNKMLVLFNKDYEATITESFVGKGAKLSFDNGRARTKVIDYHNLEIAWQDVSNFLKEIRSRKLWKTWRKSI